MKKVLVCLLNFLILTLFSCNEKQKVENVFEEKQNSFISNLDFSKVTEKQIDFIKDEGKVFYSKDLAKKRF